MSLKGKTVFLAGATGLVGTSILRYLLDNCSDTKIRASFYSDIEPIIKDERIDYVYCDLMSMEDCRRAASSCDCAIMAAAFTGGAELVKSSPWRHIKDNLIMNSQMLEAFCLEKIKRIVYIGSATLYQEFEGSIAENELDLNKDPHKDYLGFGWVVRFIEKLCSFLHQKYGIEIAIARASNIFGPYARFDPKTSNFIPAIIRKAVNKMDPFEVWGYPNVTRDVIYSDDFARAIVMMANDDNIKFDIFNIGSGTKVTVGEIVELALRFSNHKPKDIRYIQDRPTTMNFRVLDCRKIKNLLDWEPQNTIEDGIRKTTQWWIENKGWWTR